MDHKRIIRTYVLFIRPCAQEEMDWFRNQPNLESAIERAALATKRNGKRYSHQRRIKKSTLEQAKIALLESEKLIEQCKNFNEIYEVIRDKVQIINGIGELYIYDTSLRIGAKLNLMPQKIYLHAGTREGAVALGFSRKSFSLEVSTLPVEFQYLEPYEIEDVLCIFKKELSDMKSFEASEVLNRSWCT